MILQGNQRGGAKDLARHLVKDENDHVEIHELRGFVANDLHGALNEIYAVSRGTRAKQYLYSLSLNPPPTERVPTTTFDDAINRAELALGLQGQSRAVVFHEKNGRRHAHAVWSRIDPVGMKAIQLSFSKRKLMELSRDLYIENDWKMPKGMINSQSKDPLNFTFSQWQQAKRQGTDPRTIKAALQDSWSVSDTQTEFAAALTKRGYTLARGDRRGFVAVDFRGEAYSISRWVGVRAPKVRAKLTEPDVLTDLTGARFEVAKQMSQVLSNAAQKNKSVIDTNLGKLAQKKSKMADRHLRERNILRASHRQGRAKEIANQERHIRRNWRWILGQLTGYNRWNTQRAQHASFRSLERNRAEMDALIIHQLDEKQSMEIKLAEANRTSKKTHRSLLDDLNQYRNMMRGNQQKYSVPFQNPGGPV